MAVTVVVDASQMPSPQRTSEQAPQGVPSSCTFLILTLPSLPFHSKPSLTLDSKHVQSYAQHHNTITNSYFLTHFNPEDIVILPGGSLSGLLDRSLSGLAHRVPILVLSPFESDQFTYQEPRNPGI